MATHAVPSSMIRSSTEYELIAWAMLPVSQIGDDGGLQAAILAWTLSVLRLHRGLFSVREGKGGRARLYCANGCDRGELELAVAMTPGQQPPSVTDSGDVAAARERKRERALALWRGSEPATGTLADRYLTARGLPDLASSPHSGFGRHAASGKRTTSGAGRGSAERGR